MITTHYNDCDPSADARAKRKRWLKYWLMRGVWSMLLSVISTREPILSVVLNCNLGKKKLHLKHTSETSNTVWHVGSYSGKLQSGVFISEIASLLSFSLFKRRDKEDFQNPFTTFIFPQLIFPQYSPKLTVKWQRNRWVVAFAKFCTVSVVVLRLAWNCFKSNRNGYKIHWPCLLLLFLISIGSCQ